MNGKLIGVGIGPGDPELITIKAVNAIKQADIIALPQTKSSNIALDIASLYIEGKELLFIDTPMIRNQPKDGEIYQVAAKKISEKLDEGKNIVFITLGDPCIYSTYIYIHKLVLKAGYEASIIPGITSFSASAAAINDSLCEAEELLHIIPASYSNIETYLDYPGNKVLMKTGKKLKDVIDILNEKGLTNQTTMVEKCGMPDQVIYRNLDDIDFNNSYFSLLIVKEKEGNR